RATDSPMVERAAVLSATRRDRILRASPWALAVDDADRAADEKSAARLQRSVFSILRPMWFVRAVAGIRADAAPRPRCIGRAGVYFCSVPDVAGCAPSGAVRVLDAAGSDGAPFVFRGPAATVARFVRRVVVDAGPGVRLLPLLPVDAHRDLVDLVCRGSRAMVADCACGCGVGGRRAGHGTHRLRLREVPARLWAS